MIYTVKYLEPSGEKEVEAQLEVADTNMDDLPLLLTEFADKICGAPGLKVTSIYVADNEEDYEEGLDHLKEMLCDKLDEDRPLFAGKNFNRRGYGGYNGYRGAGHSKVADKIANGEKLSKEDEKELDNINKDQYKDI